MVFVSLIIPSYNEKSNLENLLPVLLDQFRKDSNSFEIIIVDDNSPDGTWSYIGELEKRIPELRLLRRVHARGLSSAVLDGMAIAKGEVFVVMDADFQHDEKLIPVLVNSLKDYEIAIGSRKVEEGSYGDWNFPRKLLSKLGSWVTAMFLKLNYSEPLSGFFAIRRSIYEANVESINPRGFKVLLEFLVRSQNKKVTEIGYTFRNRKYGKTKLSKAVILDFVFAVMEIKFGKIFSAIFLRYSVTGLSGLFVNLFGQWIGNVCLGLESYEVRKGLYLPGLSVGLGFLFSLVNNFILNNFWTFADRKFQEPKGIFKGFGKFLLVSITGLAIQVSIWRYFLSLFLSLEFGINEITLSYSANILAILVVTIWNYYLNRNFTWK